MKRLATLALLGLALISPAMLVGCGEEAKPVADTPKVDAPKADAPKADAPKADAPK